jgi:ribosomal protein S27AE
MATNTKLCCPKCGTEMNRHAEKLVYSDSPAGDSALGGVIEEAHACPGCGNIESRRL